MGTGIAVALLPLMGPLGRILCAVDRAEEYREQMIVLGAHAGEGLAAHFGSTTDRVVREAGCPALTFRPAGSHP